MSSERDQGVRAFERRAWADAHAKLSVAAAGADGAMTADDLDRLAAAAYLTGHDADSDDAYARAHHEWIRTGNPARAARSAFWLGFGLQVRGEHALGGGWLARAQRLLDDGELDCAERGYLLVPTALASLDRGDPQAAYDAFQAAGEFGERFGEPDLITFGRLGSGQALIHLGRTAEGVALLDEAMLTATEDEVSTRITGLVYCAVLSECQGLFDLRRARQWTAALTQWCDAQPDVVPYRGQCLVHRAELMQLQGDWPDALDEAQLACERLATHPAVALAHYQLGELHRLRGEFVAAEHAYREASRRGFVPQPGLALLRLIQGQVDAAAAAMRTAIEQARDRVERSRLLSAHVEIMLAASDVPSARAAADQLTAIAAELAMPYAQAVALHATGAVLRAEGHGRAAFTVLRQAWSAWQQLDAPYQAARVRVLIGQACQDFGDYDGAALELDAARWVFRQLGAAPDIGRTEKLALAGRATAHERLTAREVQVLRLVAAGKSNRAIAADLVLSEKTVARHVSNILTKLDLPSRSAATAYAYEHNLV